MKTFLNVFKQEIGSKIEEAYKITVISEYQVFLKQGK